MLRSSIPTNLQHVRLEIIYTNVNCPIINLSPQPGNILIYAIRQLPSPVPPLRIHSIQPSVHKGRRRADHSLNMILEPPGPVRTNVKRLGRVLDVPCLINRPAFVANIAVLSPQPTPYFFRVQVPIHGYDAAKTPQIMGTGSKFQNELEPRAVVKVGEPGDIGVVEIQDMLFTVSGKTAGAVLMEWNVHESTQGSAGLWGKFIL
jgi:hypothetical protein